MAAYDVITIGNAILDTFLSLHGASEFARFNKETEELCIRSGAKVMLDGADFCLGGNASNVAVGLSRLGHKVALMAELGDDEFSEKLLHGLQKEGVSLSLIKRTKDAPSTFSVILNILGDRTAFIRHVKREHAFSFDGFQTPWIYLTSIGEKWKKVYADVIEYKKTHNVRLAFNPGSAQIQEGPESFKNVLAVTDILFVNRDEAEILLHGKAVAKEQRETEENLLFRIQRMGPKMIVMTDGDNGSYVLDDHAALFYETCASANIVEKTGAGDAFGTGFLGAMLAGKSVQEAMQWGAADAASVIEYVGAQPGLLTHHGMTERLKKHPMKIKVMDDNVAQSPEVLAS